MIFLRNINGAVEAFGDITTAGGVFDLAVTDGEWAAALCGAHLEGGGIVLGHDSAGLAAIVRAERDARLVRDCDALTPLRLYAMGAAGRRAWAAYRQALLDIPQTEGFPWDGKAVPWPEKPNF